MTKAVLVDLEVLLQLTGVGAVQTDMATGRFVQVNPAFCEMVGYSAAEVQAMTYLELTYPDDRERDAESFAALQRSENQGGSSLTRCVRKDGRVVWLELHVSVIGEGDQALNLTVVNDVTERKRIETDLRASEAQLRGWEERYRVALEAAELATWDWDVPTDRVMWNERHYRLLGLEPHPGDLDGEAFLRHVHPQDVVGVRRVFEDALSHSGVYGTEFRILRADTQEERWMSGYGRVVEQQGERVTRMSGVTYDITLRKEAEAVLRDLNTNLERRVTERTEALRHSEQRFSQAFYSNPIPACMTTLGRETFVEVNDAFLALTGYGREEVVNKTSLELKMWSSPEDQRSVGEVLRDGKGFRNLELSLRTKEGAARTVMMSSEVIRLNGDEGSLKMFYDVTEQRRSEEQLYRAIQEVMSDTAWFSRSVMERLARVRSGQRDATPVEELTPRERQVLSQLAQGKSNKAIGRELGLATQTVRNYISVLYDKLGVHSRAEAVVWARERGVS